MAYFVGVDTGGTFTDCVIMDGDGKLVLGKSPSTPPDFAVGVLGAVGVAAESMGLTLEDLLQQTVLFTHGTTVATNAMLTRSGARTGLITTEGFEDTIIMMRAIGRVVGLTEEEIKHMVATNKPVPIVPRTLIKGVTERVDYKGAVLRALDKEAARRAIKELVDEGVEAIAVCFLWSFMNPTHEREVLRLIKEMYPGVFASISSDLTPKLGEYERTATAAINAYVGPATSRYIASFSDQLKGKGFAYVPLIMQAYGGCLPADRAVERPVEMIGSGPAGGVIGSKFMAELMGHNNVITTDVGGTSFDVGLIYGGVPELAKEPSIGQYRLMVPSIEIKSIGAGGGSIAWVEPVTNLLKVGPRSAGARPGPVCYDAGGTDPTVTDADLVLGYL
ncbi:MAG: hydantoinase/oxoprolinase family protein, partial [Dehalococcoidia bacterium]|nr:hydantoinase/oxoprolinase family protein [Dehalococcoidia bacterium]